MHREIYLTGIIEPATTAFLRKIATPGWTFFDVGANEGYYALLSIDLGGPSARAYAFEPQPAVSHRLRSSVRRNAYPVIVVEAVCAATEGEIELYPSSEPDNSGAASVVPGVRGTQPFTAHAITLDSFCERINTWPTAMKIDVEGYELEVLRGFVVGLERHPPSMIIAELTDDPRHPTHCLVAPFLANFGYVAHRISERGDLIAFDEPRGLENVVFRR